MDGSRRLLTAIIASATVCSGQSGSAQTEPGISRTLPAAKVETLTGQQLHLPQDLSSPANVIILGFGRNSQDATTAWERPIRTQLARPGAINFFDVAVLAEIPSLIRPLVLRAIKRQVPDVLKPNFFTLTENEDAWKQTAGYASGQPDAAYVLLVGKTGSVQWATHAPFSPAGFQELHHRAEELARQETPR